MLRYIAKYDDGMNFVLGDQHTMHTYTLTFSSCSFRSLIPLPWCLIFFSYCCSYCWRCCCFWERIRERERRTGESNLQIRINKNNCTRFYGKKVAQYANIIELLANLTFSMKWTSCGEWTWMKLNLSKAANQRYSNSFTHIMDKEYVFVTLSKFGGKVFYSHFLIVRWDANILEQSQRYHRNADWLNHNFQPKVMWLHLPLLCSNLLDLLEPLQISNHWIIATLSNLQRTTFRTCVYLCSYRRRRHSHTCTRYDPI